MASKDSIPSSTEASTEKTDPQPDPNDVMGDLNDEQRQDAGRPASRNKSDDSQTTKEAPAADEKAPLSRTRLLLIWVGLWLAVFLYSLVSRCGIGP